MAKIITVWGNSGSGKSTFSCMLARRLTRDKEKAIIISPDTSTPMLPVWFPNENIEAAMSLGQVLSAVSIDNALVASKVVLYKAYPFIGAMGYAAGETPLSYPEIEPAKIKSLLYAAGSLVDYLIIDCPTPMTTVFTPMAIEQSDAVVRILTPDLHGIHYFKAHQPLMKEERFRFDEHITLGGKARPFQAIEEMGHLLGEFKGLLPYSKEIERCGTQGEMFSALEYCSKKYMASLELVCEKVKHEQQSE